MTSSLEFENGRETRLTFDGNYTGPIWTPDGRYLVATRTDGGLYWMRSDGASTAQPLLAGPQKRQFPLSINGKQKRLAFMEEYRANTYHLWTAPFEFDGSGVRAGKPEPFFHTPDKDERHPMFSPDGRWLAYTSNEFGKNQIYVRAFPGSPSSGRWLISKEGGVYPAWSRDGSQLFFRTEDNQIMVAENARLPPIRLPVTVRGLGPIAGSPISGRPQITMSIRMGRGLSASSRMRLPSRDIK
jgi:Tol biopolymer transport system component